MKSSLYYIILTVLFLSCNQKSTKTLGVKLKPETPSYEAAKELAEIYTFLNPDINHVIVVANSFTVTTGDVIDEINFFLPILINKMISDINQKEVRDLVYNRAKLISQRRALISAARAEGIIISSETIDSLVSKFRIIGVEQKDISSYLISKGKTAAYLRKWIEEEELYRRFIHIKLNDKVKADEQEILKAYQNSNYLNLHYIFISTRNLDDKKKKEKKAIMSRVERLIQNGFSFGELANKYSEGSDDERHIIGVYKGRFSSKIDSVIFGLNEGEISEVIETNEGLYIFQINEHLKDTRTFEDAYLVYKSQVERDKRVFFEQKITKEIIEKEELKFNNDI